MFSISESELRQVLEALEIQEKRMAGEYHLSAEAFTPMWNAAITTLRKRLEEAPATEPQGEREAFEAAVAAMPGHPFAGQFLNLMWKAFQAGRASLSASTPSAAVRSDTERDAVQPCVRLHITPTDEWPDVQAEVLDGGQLPESGQIDLYAAPQPAPEPQRDAVQPGWKLVPVEPTWDMKIAASTAYREPRDGHYTARMECAAEAYRVMLDAAPQPAPEPQQDQLQQPDGHSTRASGVCASTAPLPGGFRLLPVEATDSMMDADWDVSMSDAHSNGGVSAAAWRAMVEAAPQVTYGNGHSGLGWYMHDTDYPEEGAVFLGAAAPRCASTVRYAPWSAKTDAEMLHTLSVEFENSVSYCECGRAEPLRDFDCASMLRDYMAQRCTKP